MSSPDILGGLREVQAGDVDWSKGQCFGYVYDPGPEAQGLMQEALLLYLNSTVLDTQAFPSSKILEKRVDDFARKILRVPDSGVSTFTTGGTESIFLSVLAHREWGRKEKGIREANIVIADTAHPAFVKACFYLDMRPIIVAADPDYKADARKVAYYADNYANSNTVAIVGSAPAYGTGQVDPLRELGEFAESEDIGFIVDGCVGGGILPFMGEGLLDFTIPGVTAITLDWHKWFMSLKGASSVVYRDAKMLEYQTFSHSAWMGYPIVNPTVTSTRSSGHIAATVAVLEYFGVEGYREIAQDIMRTSQVIKDYLSQSKHLALVGDPPLNVFSVRSTTSEVNIFRLQQELRRNGWYIQPQTSFGDMPASCHVSVNRGNVGREQAFVDELDRILQQGNLSEETEYDLVNNLSIKKRDAAFKRSRIF